MERKSPTVLYTCPRSTYLTLDVDCWDKKRDATLFRGPGPVIAHPPCTSWGRLKAFCRTDDAATGPIAVSQVRRYGGILEHPVDSTLFHACGMPTTPGQRDFDGGYTIVIDQLLWGHRAQKRTWLYIVTDGEPVTFPPPATPGATIQQPVQNMDQGERLRTPRPFAIALIKAASQCYRN